MIDPSVITLVLSNFITIVYAYLFKWELKDLLIVYWWQSIIIGVFQFIKILELKDYSTDGVVINGHKVEATIKTKINLALFFAFHYGLFHLVYLIFITAFEFNIVKTLPMAGVFFVNHFYSYLINRKKDINQKQNIGSVFLKPYTRIIPMHWTLIFGKMLFPGLSIVFFQLLKTVVDVLSHKIEHNNLTI